MQQVNISILESVLQNDRYNQSILAIICDHYANNSYSVNLINLIDQYRSDLTCPPVIKHMITEASIQLSLYDSAITLLENNDDAKSSLLKARCFYSLNKLSQAKSYYELAISKDSTLNDAKLEELIEKNTPLKKVDSNVVVFRQPEIKTLDENKIIFNDVGGLVEVKKQITRRIIAPFIKPGVFQRFKRRAGGGILLYGPPGCGKTLLARATAGECKAKFYNVMLTDILSKWSGESEKNLHDIFEDARKNAPSILFFDEIESIASKRNYDGNGSATSASLISLFLTELDGFSQNNDGVLVLGATNIPWSIDNAFLRPGRFDREFFVPPPDYIARLAILKNVLSDKPCADDIDIDYLAKNTTGFSGADLKHLISRAEDEAIDQMLSGEEEVKLNQNMMKIALKNSSPSTLEWLAIARNFVEFSNDTGKYNDIRDFLKAYERKR